MVDGNLAMAEIYVKGEQAVNGHRRTIFRGKRCDGGGWIFGDLTHNSFGEPSIFLFINGSFNPVFPETVGQWTGMLDKKGAKIWEGDIVKTQPFSDRPYSQTKKSMRHIGEVQFKTYQHLDGAFWDAKWEVSIKNEQGYGCSDWGPFFDCEVIGNTTDNPELMQP